MLRSQHEYLPFRYVTFTSYRYQHPSLCIHLLMYRCYPFYASYPQDKPGQSKEVEALVIPPAPFLAPVAAALEGTDVALGAQDVYPAAKGASAA